MGKSPMSPHPGTALRRGPTATRAGILRPEEFARHAALARHRCADVLDTYVEHYWGVTWQLPAGRTHLSSTLAHPAGHLTVEWGGGTRRGARAPGEAPSVWVTGVATRRFDVRINGTGGVLGVKFRPGGLAAMLSIDPLPIRDATARGERLRPGLDELLVDLAVPLDDDSAGELDHRLSRLAPEPSAAYLQLLDVIEMALGNRALIRVEQLAEVAETSPRSLQRMFAKFLGVGPKWVLARYRLHDAVTAIDEGYAGSLTDLAIELGWFDQAHFIADFSTLVGKTPDAYRRDRTRGAH